jgi:hypothetical protein
MPSTKFFSINRAADLLERDRRTVARALRGIAPDQRERGQDRWKLPTIVAALTAHASRTGGQQGRGGSVLEVAPIADQAEAALNAIDAGLDRLQAEPDLTRRRELAWDVGPAFGALDRALAQCIALESNDLQPALEIFRHHVIGGLIGEFLATCHWQIAGDGARSGSNVRDARSGK